MKYGHNFTVYISLIFIRAVIQMCRIQWVLWVRIYLWLTFIAAPILWRHYQPHILKHLRNILHVALLLWLPFMFRNRRACHGAYLYDICDVCALPTIRYCIRRSHFSMELYRESLILVHYIQTLCPAETAFGPKFESSVSLSCHIVRSWAFIIKTLIKSTAPFLCYYSSHIQIHKERKKRPHFVGLDKSTLFISMHCCWFNVWINE